jgi:uncharacterized membrane protein YagU involved in acid resistance
MFLIWYDNENNARMDGFYGFSLMCLAFFFLCFSIIITVLVCLVRVSLSKKNNN